MADLPQLIERTMTAARRTFREEPARAYTIDPIFNGLRRNRVNAELLKTALRLDPQDAERLGYGPLFQEKMVRAMLDGQKPSGCWHEIHPNYDQPSALATAFIGEALVDYISTAVPGGALAKELEASIESARRYVLDQEIRPGFFLKSSGYRGDHLNVDVSCGAFLAKYSNYREDPKSRDAALRAVDLVAREQFENGAYPYTTNDAAPPYPHPLNLPCIHYQGVTGYYLAKIHEVVPTATAEQSLKRAASWLASVQQKDGRFDWSKSHMMFAYQLSGAYAFAAALFSYVAQWDPEHAERSRKAVSVLDRNVPGLALRWEKSSVKQLPADVYRALRSASWPGLPLGTKLQRTGYAGYRQLARQRYAEKAEVRLFNFLTRTLKIKTSTVEPSKNFPDLFMTAEAADCLSAAWAFERRATK